MTTVSQILQEARALIEQGWIQGWYLHIREDGGHEYCILGALNQAHENLGCLTAESMEAVRVLTDHLLGNMTWLEEFNDDPSTTKRRVLALFDRALMEVSK